MLVMSLDRFAGLNGTRVMSLGGTQALNLDGVRTLNLGGTRTLNLGAFGYSGFGTYTDDQINNELDPATRQRMIDYNKTATDHGPALTYADQGPSFTVGSPGFDWGSMLGTIFNRVLGTNQQPPPTVIQPQRQDNTMMYLVGGIAALGIGAYVLTRKKK